MGDLLAGLKKGGQVLITVIFATNALAANFQFSQSAAFAVKKPTFTNTPEHYNLLYNHPNYYFGLNGGSYLNYNTISTGLEFGIDYYADNGYAAAKTNSAITKDKSEKTTLTLVPHRLLVSLTLKPIPLIRLNAGTGIEGLYSQEIRVTSGFTTSTKDDDNNSPLTNHSYHPYYVINASLGISLNFLERRAIYSLNRTFGINNVFLTTHFELAHKLTANGVDFSRRTLALGMVFESTK